MRLEDNLKSYRKEEWVYNKFNCFLPVREVIKVYTKDDKIPYLFSKFIEGKTV